MVLRNPRILGRLTVPSKNSAIPESSQSAGNLRRKQSPRRAILPHHCKLFHVLLLFNHLESLSIAIHTGPPFGVLPNCHMSIMVPLCLQWY